MRTGPKKPLTIPLDQVLRLLHLLEQLSVANDTRRIPDLAARLVEARDDPHDRALSHVSEVCDLLEGLSS